MLVLKGGNNAKTLNLLCCLLLFLECEKIVGKQFVEDNMSDLICKKFRANAILFVVKRGNNAGTLNLFCCLLLFFRVCKK